jgi:hypothetical protein
MIPQLEGVVKYLAVNIQLSDFRWLKERLLETRPPDVEPVVEAAPESEGAKGVLPTDAPRAAP